MKKILLFILLPTQWMFGQLQVTSGITAYDLVQGFLIGQGVQLIDSSVTFQGSSNAIGAFNGTSSNIGLSYGVILTTGDIWKAVGPNNGPNAGVDNGFGGYSLLDNIVSPSQTYNATVISFTFIPSGDSIFLKYVFGSEEYLESVGTEFNDVFGLFLSGPNPTGGNYINQNIAIIPWTSTIVSINNVNHINNASYFIDNASPGLSVQYDGFTVPLKASAAVVVDSAYTITFAIADVADGTYDSGLFLEEYSFTSGTNIGIDETASSPFNIFPVPADNYIQVQSINNVSMENISIMDGLGRIVLNENVQSTSTILDISNLAPGMYIISVHTSSGRTNKKIIVY